MSLARLNAHLRGREPEGLTVPVRVLMGALSGLALTAAFPPLDQGWVALLALVPLLVALRGARARVGALVGSVAGLVFFGVLLYWISYFGYAAWIALVLLMSVSWALFGAFTARAGRLGALGRLIGAPLLFAAFEMARGSIPLGGFTWGALGASQHGGGPTVHLARIVGMFGLTLALVMVNALIAEAIAARSRQRAVVCALVVSAIVLMPVSIPLLPARDDGPTIDIAAVQGNVPRERFTGLGRRGRIGPEDSIIIWNHMRVTGSFLSTVTPPDLVVWPENAFDRDPRSAPELFDPVVELMRRVGSPLLFGAILDVGDRFTNSNLLVAPDGQMIGRYDKRHLVPFGEYVPAPIFRRIVPALDRELPTNGIAGRVPAVFDVGAARVGSVICFESTYPGLVRDEVRAGAQVIVVTTNNASFGTSPAARQHLAMSQMRAIENGRAVVHAAIAGVSAIIAPDGRIIATAPLFEPALLRARLPLSDARSPYTRFGPWIESAMVLGAAVFVIASFVRRRGRGGA